MCLLDLCLLDLEGHDAEDRRMGEQMMKGHIACHENCWELHMRPDPHAIIKQIEAGNYDEICGMLLGKNEWEMLSRSQKREYEYYWAKVLAVWNEMFMKGSGISPPDTTIVVR